MHRWTFTTAGASAVLAVGAIVLPGVARASQGAAAAASAAARAWAADVPATARLGAEPAGRCRRLDARRAACPIAVVELLLISPKDQPLHCPPAVTQVHFHDGRLTYRVVSHYAPWRHTGGPSAIERASRARGTDAAPTQRLPSGRA